MKLNGKEMISGDYISYFGAGNYSEPNFYYMSLSKGSLYGRDSCLYNARYPTLFYCNN